MKARNDHSRTSFFAWASVIPLVATCGLIVTGCESPFSLLNLAIVVPDSRSENAISTDQDDASGDEETKSNAAEVLVKDWQQPDVTLLVTGRLHGYIEPCGCTGLTNQKGGLLRRHTCQKMLVDKGWQPVCIDAGNMIRRFGQQPSLKMKTAFRSIAGIMKFDAIGIGIDDLKVAGADMLVAIDEVGRESTPFTSANMSLFEDESYVAPFQIIENRGRKIGIVSVIGEEHVKKYLADGGSDDYTVTMPQDAIARVIADPKFAACDVKVVTIQSGPENCKQLARKFPVFDLVVTAGGAGDPTLRPEEIKHANGSSSQMIQCGVKGMYVGVVGVDFGAGGKKSLKYQRVALDASFKDSEPVKAVFLEYQTELKDLWLGGLLEDIQPRPHQSGQKFVGSDACQDCHEEEYDIWKDGIEGDIGPHAKATADLTNPGERTWVKRNFDPECVSCHVTGWNPQGYYPYETGYLDLDKDILLHGNGCENCHGPGSGHVRAENAGDDVDLMERFRNEMVVTIEEAKRETCYKCHDLDNSPDYAEADDGWEKYWPAIAHGDDD